VNERKHGSDGNNGDAGGDTNAMRSIRALCSLLDEQARFLSHLTDDEYTDRPDPTTSSIASHIRHTLDHVAAIMRGAAQGMIDYDDRERDTQVERNRTVALEAIRSLRTELVALPDRAYTARLDVRGLVCADQPQITAASTVARELLYVLSHTVHHHAMIASIGKSLGVAVPETFGYAPSTLAHLREA
jgi:uncharacterized damage-inducible protein DinB